VTRIIALRFLKSAAHCAGREPVDCRSWLSRWRRHQLVGEQVVLNLPAPDFPPRSGFFPGSMDALTALFGGLPWQIFDLAADWYRLAFCCAAGERRL